MNLRFIAMTLLFCFYNLLFTVIAQADSSVELPSGKLLKNPHSTFAKDYPQSDLLEFGEDVPVNRIPRRKKKRKLNRKMLESEEDITEKKNKHISRRKKKKKLNRKMLESGEDFPKKKRHSKNLKTRRNKPEVITKTVKGVLKNRNPVDIIVHIQMLE